MATKKAKALKTKARVKDVSGKQGAGVKGGSMLAQTSVSVSAKPTVPRLPTRPIAR